MQKDTFRKRQISIYLSGEEINTIDRLAKQDDRSRSQYIERLIREALEQRQQNPNAGQPDADPFVFLEKA
jgi:metal-responsive CopG/Arc/MetJ family transcriptional regulator